MPPVGNERGVRLALDQLLAGELRDRRAVARGRVEGVVLLGCGVRQRLEPVRVVGGALLHRPFLHRLRDRVGERGVQRLAACERPLQRLVDVLGQAASLDRRREHVRAEDLVVRDRQIGRPERCSVGTPLRGGDILLTGPGHERGRFLLKELGPTWKRAPTRAKPKAIVVPSGLKGITQWRNRRCSLFDSRPNGRG